MKATKLCLLLVFFAIAGTTFAQKPNNQKDIHPGPPPIPTEEQISKTIDQLAKEISLSESQKKNMLNLYKQHFKKLKERICSDNPPNRNEMEKLRTEFEKSVKALLSGYSGDTDPHSGKLTPPIDFNSKNRLKLS